MRRASSALAALLGLAAPTVGVLGGCIIPDSQPIVRKDLGNPGAVRLVEPIPLTRRAHEACQDVEPGLVACPMPLPTQPLGLIDFSEQDQPFCVCPGRDANALGSFEIFVEDPDVHRAEVPRDDILGAFLLDLPRNFDPEKDDPSDFLAYQNYLSPSAPAQLVPLLDRTQIGRRNPNLKSWILAPESGRVDLCNDNDGRKLEPGIHTVRLIVTDRPWYVPVELDENGRVVRDDRGNAIPSNSEPLVGVPDLPGGATYATASIVFRCSLFGGSVACNCVTGEMEQ